MKGNIQNSNRVRSMGAGRSINVAIQGELLLKDVTIEEVALLIAQTAYAFAFEVDEHSLEQFLGEEGALGEDGARGLPFMESLIEEIRMNGNRPLHDLIEFLDGKTYLFRSKDHLSLTLDVFEDDDDPDDEEGALDRDSFESRSRIDGQFYDDLFGALSLRVRGFGIIFEPDRDFEDWCTAFRASVVATGLRAIVDPPG